MNIFAGARRLALVIAGGVSLTVLSLAATTEHSGDVVLAVTRPWGSAALVAACDGEDNAREYKRVTTSEGMSGLVELCFVAMRTPDGSMVVPFKRDGKGFLLHTRYSPEVTNYTDAYAEGLVLRPVTERVIESRAKSERAETWMKVALGLPAFWLVGWLAVAIAGWIVRGFAGIPSGQDSKS